MITFNVVVAKGRNEGEEPGADSEPTPGKEKIVLELPDPSDDERRLFRKGEVEAEQADAVG